MEIQTHVRIRRSQCVIPINMSSMSFFFGYHVNIYSSFENHNFLLDSPFMFLNLFRRAQRGNVFKQVPQLNVCYHVNVSSSFEITIFCKIVPIEFSESSLKSFKELDLARPCSHFQNRHSDAYCYHFSLKLPYLILSSINDY